MHILCDTTYLYTWDERIFRRMKEKNKRKKQQAASGKNYTGLVLTCIMTAIAVIYVGFAIYFESHFCFGTSIDGIAVDGSSVEKVEDAFRTEMKNYQLTVTAREDKNGTIAGSDIDMEPVFQGEIETLLNEQNGFSWLIRMFQKQEFELEKVVSYDEQKLNEAVSNLPCMKDQRTPVDATYANYTKENGYALVPADYGTEVDAAKVKKAVSDAILVLDETVDLEQSDCYRKPAVGDDDKDLLDLIDTLNQYVGVTITYDFGDDKEVLDGTTISTWLSEGTDEKVSIDEEEVLAFVKTLAKKYNTAYSPKELKTSYGTTVTVTGGFYGWRIDNSGEVEQILADLKAGKDVEREPVYLTTANSHGEHDYGDSYVEINLTNQHLFLYKDGKLVVESDFVSGNLAKGHDTPTGAFGLTYKTMNAVLRGPDYETPVTYWMPFNGDVGMHDATWRNKFGGSIYKTGGSHGCINLPASAAKKIYETIDKGYAVLVYRMPADTPTVVQQPQADVPSVINAISIIGPVTLESETAIVNARNMYNSLSDADKAQVTNYDTLTAAEAALAALKAQQPADGGQQPDQSQPQDQGQQPDQSQPQDQSQQPDQSQPQDQSQQPDQSQPQDQGQQSDQSQPQDQG